MQILTLEINVFISLLKGSHTIWLNIQMRAQRVIIGILTSYLWGFFGLCSIQMRENLQASVYGAVGVFV